MFLKQQTRARLDWSTAAFDLIEAKSRQGFRKAMENNFWLVSKVLQTKNRAWLRFYWFKVGVNCRHRHRKLSQKDHHVFQGVWGLGSRCTISIIEITEVFMTIQSISQVSSVLIRVSGGQSLLQLSFKKIIRAYCGMVIRLINISKQSHNGNL